jgi:hypothetical protein
MTCAVKDVLGVKTKTFLVGFWQELPCNLIEPLHQLSVGAVTVNQDASDDNDRLLARASSLIQESYAHNVLSANWSPHYAEPPLAASYQIWCPVRQV